MEADSSRVRRGLRRYGLPVAFAAVFLYAIMGSHRLERFLIYFPSRDMGVDPSLVGLPFDDVWLRADDGVRIHGWFVPHPAARHTLLIFHGNAGNISHRLYWIDLLHRLPANVFIIDYRGYGRSEGQPHENGLYQDARAAWDWWTRERQSRPEGVVLFGESLGGAVAVHLAARVSCSGVVLQSTFSSARDMARSVFPLGLLRPLAGVRFDSEMEIRNVRAPKLFVHGDRDEIVPFELGRRLYDAANPPKEFYEVPGAHHNDLVQIGGNEYFQRIRRFLGSLK